MHFVAYNTPRGILMLLAFICAIFAVVKWRATSPPSWASVVPWFSWSWLFFVASFIFL